MSVCDSVDLPDPFGPITAWTSPLSMLSETPFRIWRPSTLARKSLISKSANFPIALLHLVSAVVRSVGHPGRPRHVGADQALVHLLLGDARQAGAGGDVLDGAVAVTDGEAAVLERDHLGHVAVLGGQPGQLSDPRLKV